MVEQDKSLRLSPKDRDRVAILVSHGEFAKLLSLEGRIAGRAVLQLFGNCVLVHGRYIVLDVHFGHDERMRVVDIVGIGGILAWPYEEWLNGARGAVRIHNLLGKAGGCGSGITVESLSARESPEIRIERAILLVQHEDVLDVLLNQADKLRVGQTWFGIVQGVLWSICLCAARNCGLAAAAVPNGWIASMIESATGTVRSLFTAILSPLVADISATHNCRMARSMRKMLRKAGIESGVPVVYSTEGHRELPPVASHCGIDCICPNRGDQVFSCDHRRVILGS